MKKRSQYKQGFFKPLNPKKYKGNPTNIVYRSSWELKLMSRVDKDNTITEWSSEEIILRYVAPHDNKVHRYFPDLWYKKNDGSEYLIEIKPAAQTKPPAVKKRVTKRYLTEVIEWGKNQAKWESAREYCKAKGWTFLILTEKELGIK